MNAKTNREILETKIDLIHTTTLGDLRIKNNLHITTDSVLYCKDIIKNKDSFIYKEGKNWYIVKDKIIITVNSYNYCIITAHLKK